jgi:hypothetical protein
MLGIYRVAAQLVASRVVLSSTELVTYVQDLQCGSHKATPTITTGLYVATGLLSRP